MALDAASIGTFNGLIGRSPFANDNLGGCIKINTTVVGGFTGTLKLGSKSYPLSGALNTASTTLTGTQIITRPGMTPITVTFSIPPTNRLAQGTVTSAGAVLPFTARNVSATASSFAGLHTLAITLPEPEHHNASIPQGHGYGAFTVSPRGIASGFLILSDETKITFSQPVETNGSISLFSLIYKNGGSALAQLYMDAGDENNLAASVVDWLKKPEPDTSRNLVYKAGFGPLSLNVIGRKYVPPTSGIPLEATAGTDNVRIVLDGTPSPVTIDSIFTITGGAGAGKATFKEFTVTKGTASFKPATGSLTGTFTDSGLSGKFSGIIVDEGTHQAAYGCFLLPESTTAGARKVSGSMKVTKNP
jgi:hypothetical protein